MYSLSLMLWLHPYVLTKTFCLPGRALPSTPIVASSFSRSYACPKFFPYITIPSPQHASVPSACSSLLSSNTSYFCYSASFLGLFLRMTLDLATLCCVVSSSSFLNMSSMSSMFLVFLIIVINKERMSI